MEFSEHGREYLKGRISYFKKQLESVNRERRNKIDYLKRKARELKVLNAIRKNTKL